MKNQQNYGYNFQILEKQKIRFNKIRNVLFLVVYAIFAFYFLVNGEGIFDEWTSTWTYTTLIYVAGVSIFLGVQESIPSNLQKPMIQNVIGFIGIFIFSTIVFMVLYDLGWYFNDVTSMPIGQIPAVLVFQLVIVVASEEIIFRGVLLEVFHKIHWMIAVFVTSILFALFHYAVYGGNTGALLVAFVLGMIFALCVYRWNIGVAMGLHYSWNLFVMGVTALV